MLLYGPPGTGKTLIAKALANETSAYFTHIGGPEIMGKYYGESEERLRKIFEEAQEHAPAILFIDEIDAVAPKREEMGSQQQVEKRVVAQLLSLMDGLKSRGQIAIIGATNAPQLLDPALRRPGRFDREINIGVPERNGRREILEVHTRGMPLAEDVSLDRLAEITHGFVGADLAALCREAAMVTLRKIAEDIPLDAEFIPFDLLSRLEVTMADFIEALTEVEPSALREVFTEVPGRALGGRRRPRRRQADAQADHRVAADVRRPVRARQHVAAEGRPAHGLPAAPARRCSRRPSRTSAASTSSR